MLGAVKKTFISVKEHKSRIHDIKQLKILHGTGPFVCKVESGLVSAVHHGHLDMAKLVPSCTLSSTHCNQSQTKRMLLSAQHQHWCLQS